MTQHQINLKALRDLRAIQGRVETTRLYEIEPDNGTGRKIGALLASNWAEAMNTAHDRYGPGFIAFRLMD